MRFLLITQITPPPLFPQGELRICVLPSHLSYDSPWPVRKVPTRITPHYISYHMESKVWGEGVVGGRREKAVNQPPSSPRPMLS